MISDKHESSNEPLPMSLRAQLESEAVRSGNEENPSKCQLASKVPVLCTSLQRESNFGVVAEDGVENDLVIGSPSLRLVVHT